AWRRGSALQRQLTSLDRAARHRPSCMECGDACPSRPTPGHDGRASQDRRAAPVRPTADPAPAPPAGGTERGTVETLGLVTPVRPRSMIGTTSWKLWSQPSLEATTSWKLCRSSSGAYAEAVRSRLLASRAMSVLDVRLSLARMCDTWVCTVRRDRNSSVA